MNGQNELGRSGGRKMEGRVWFAWKIVFRLEFLYGPSDLSRRPEIILGQVGNFNFGREFCTLASSNFNVVAIM